MNADGSTTWPTDVEVTFQLTKKLDKEDDAEPVTGKTLKLNAEKMSDKFTSLPKYEVVNGKEVEIIYGVKEIEVAGYTTKIDAINAGKITLTNTRDKGALKIKKIVKVNNSDLNVNYGLVKGDYTFTIVGVKDTLAEGYSSTVTLTINDEGDVSSASVIRGMGNAMAIGGYAEISDLPTGQYEINEILTPAQIQKGIYLFEKAPEDDDGKVILTVEKADVGVIPSSAEFTNNKDIGNLEIKKTVVGAKDDTKAFTFDVELTAPDEVVFETSYPAVKVVNNVETAVDNVTVTDYKITGIQLTAGESLIIRELPVGTRGTVTETSELKGYTLEGTNGREATIAQAQTSTIEFINAYEAKGNISFNAKKIFTNGNLEEQDFTIKLTQVDSADPATAKKVTDGVELTRDVAKDAVNGVVSFEEVREFVKNSTKNEAGVYVDRDDCTTEDTAYYFKLEEIIPDDAENADGVKYSEADDATKAAGGFIKDGVLYDSSVKIITVTVTDDGEGSLIVGKNPDTVKDTDNGTDLDVTFTNEQLGKIKVKKIVMNTEEEPEMLDIGEDIVFNFKITQLTPEAGKDPIVKTISVHNNEEVTVDGLPVGLYEVTEEEPTLELDNLKYAGTKMVVEDGATSDNTDTATDDAESNTVEGRTVTVELANTGDATVGIEATNSYEVDKITKTVKKVWDDDNDRDGARPLTLTVNLTANGEVVRTVTLSHENGWTAMAKELPIVDANLKEIDYEWAEVEPGNGYTLTNTTTEGTITTLTNTREIEKVDINVQKVWDDKNNAAGKRPTSIQVQLYADNKAVDEPVTLSEGNWSYTWTDLEKYSNPDGKVGGSKLIKYTVDELSVPESYTKTISGTETSFTIMNTLELGKLEIEKRFDIVEKEPEEPETPNVDIPITKAWDDNGNADGNRPASVTVRLYADGTEVANAALTAEDGWTYTFTGMPRWSDEENKVKINYTVTEDEVRWYRAQINGTNILNIYTPEYTTASVRKYWDDNNNEAGLRPESITMTLSNGTRVTLSEDNGWATTVTGLPAYINGEPVTYSWTEQEVVGYRLTNVAVDGNYALFTNHFAMVPLAEANKPKGARVGDRWYVFEEYDTALGGEILINHVGDCFD